MDPSIPQSKLPAGPDRFQEILEPLVPAFTALEALLEREILAFEPEVQPLVEYCLGHSGKKLRPILVFSLGMERENATPSPELVKAAAIVEMVHLATLVHDDILDEADLRHRTETVVSKYGPHVAVLLGDALFAHALHLAADYPGVEVCRAVSRATRQVCSGEIAQTFARGEGVPDTPAYYRMIDLKTAELFSVSAYLGGFLGGFSETALRAAGDYARHLGIAYQIYDDAADIFGREAQAGKTLGTDLATGKFTLPVLLWLENLGEAERVDALNRLQDNGTSRFNVQEILLENGILTKVRDAFFEQIALSRKAIHSIPGEARQQVLHRLADFVETAWNKFSIR